MSNFSVVTAVWPSASPTSSALKVPFAHLNGATVTISGAWTNSHIGVQVAIIPGLFFDYKDWQGGYTGVSIPTASGNTTMEAPPSWFFLPGADDAVRLWSHDGTGSGVAQNAARTVLVAGVFK